MVAPTPRPMAQGISCGFGETKVGFGGNNRGNLSNSEPPDDLTGPKCRGGGWRGEGEEGRGQVGGSAEGFKQ